MAFCREVWPERDQFGAQDIGPEEEFMAVREIFMSDLPSKYSIHWPLLLYLTSVYEIKSFIQKFMTAKSVMLDLAYQMSIVSIDPFCSA